jgi:hypothetical protein
MEAFKNSFRGGSTGLGNLPVCFIYDWKLHIHSKILVMLHGNIWIKNLDMEYEKMFGCNTDEGTKTDKV